MALLGARALSVKLVEASTFCARQTGDASRFGSDVVHDWCFKPGNLVHGSGLRISARVKMKGTIRWVPSG
jgi:hypothetical protein